MSSSYEAYKHATSSFLKWILDNSEPGVKWTSDHTSNNNSGTSGASSSGKPTRGLYDKALVPVSLLSSSVEQIVTHWQATATATATSAPQTSTKFRQSLDAALKACSRAVSLREAVQQQFRKLQDHRASDPPRCDQAPQDGHSFFIASLRSWQQRLQPLLTAIVSSDEPPEPNKPIGSNNYFDILQKLAPCGNASDNEASSDDEREEPAAPGPPAASEAASRHASAGAKAKQKSGVKEKGLGGGKGTGTSANCELSIEESERADSQTELRLAILFLLNDMDVLLERVCKAWFDFKNEQITHGAATAVTLTAMRLAANLDAVFQLKFPNYKEVTLKGLLELFSADMLLPSAAIWHENHPKAWKQYRGDSTPYQFGGVFCGLFEILGALSQFARAIPTNPGTQINYDTKRAMFGKVYHEDANPLAATNGCSLLAFLCLELSYLVNFHRFWRGQSSLLDPKLRGTHSTANVGSKKDTNGNSMFSLQFDPQVHFRLVFTFVSYFQEFFDTQRVSFSCLFAVMCWVKSVVFLQGRNFISRSWTLVKFTVWNCEDLLLAASKNPLLDKFDPSIVQSSTMVGILPLRSFIEGSKNHIFLANPVLVGTLQLDVALRLLYLGTNSTFTTNNRTKYVCQLYHAMKDRQLLKDAVDLMDTVINANVKSIFIPERDPKNRRLTRKRAVQSKPSQGRYVSTFFLSGYFSPETVRKILGTAGASSKSLPLDRLDKILRGPEMDDEFGSDLYLLLISNNLDSVLEGLGESGPQQEGVSQVNNFRSVLDAIRDIAMREQLGPRFQQLSHLKTANRILGLSMYNVNSACFSLLHDLWQACKDPKCPPILRQSNPEPTLQQEFTVCAALRCLDGGLPGSDTALPYLVKTLNDLFKAHFLNTSYEHNEASVSASRARIIPEVMFVDRFYVLPNYANTQSAVFGKLNSNRTNTDSTSELFCTWMDRLEDAIEQQATISDTQLYDLWDTLVKIDPGVAMMRSPLDKLSSLAHHAVAGGITNDQDYRRRFFEFLLQINGLYGDSLASINRPNPPPQSEPLLHLCAERGDISKCKTIIDVSHGETIDILFRDESALYRTAKNRHEQVANFLIKQGANPYLGKSCPEMKMGSAQCLLSNSSLRFIESQLAAGSIKKSVGRACNRSGCTKVGLQKCGQCLCASYCSAECQKYDWKQGGHKLVCLPARP